MLGPLTKMSKMTANKKILTQKKTSVSNKSFYLMLDEGVLSTSGNMDDSIYSSMGYSQLMEYVHQKHGLSEAVMDWVNILALQGYLLKLKVQHRASIVKWVHDWILTYTTLCRQDREPCYLCTCCNSFIETSTHVISCPNLDAMNVCQN